MLRGRGSSPTPPDQKQGNGYDDGLPGCAEEGKRGATYRRLPSPGQKMRGERLPRHTTKTIIRDVEEKQFSSVLFFFFF